MMNGVAYNSGVGMEVLHHHTARNDMDSDISMNASDPWIHATSSIPTPTSSNGGNKTNLLRGLSSGFANFTTDLSSLSQSSAQPISSNAGVPMSSYDSFDLVPGDRQQHDGVNTQHMAGAVMAHDAIRKRPRQVTEDAFLSSIDHLPVEFAMPQHAPSSNLNGTVNGNVNGNANATHHMPMQHNVNATVDRNHYHPVASSVHVQSSAPVPGHPQRTDSLDITSLGAHHQAHFEPQYATAAHYDIGTAYPNDFPYPPHMSNAQRAVNQIQMPTANLAANVNTLSTRQSSATANKSVRATAHHGTKATKTARSTNMSTSPSETSLNGGSGSPTGSTSTRLSRAAKNKALDNISIDASTVGSTNTYNPSPPNDSPDNDWDGDGDDMSMTMNGRSNGSGSNQGMDKETDKKIKHQQTDRQRRAKIKQGMDELKALVIDDPQAKPDQVSIVQASVTLVHDLKSEVATLKAKLQQAEMEKTRKEQESQLALLRRQRSSSGTPDDTQIANPLAYIMPSMNASGISVWRVSTSGIMLEVNMVFEMLTGHRNSTLVGKSPCQAPMYGSLSIVPESFLRLFSNACKIQDDTPKIANSPFSNYPPSADDNTYNKKSSPSVSSTASTQSPADSLEGDGRDTISAELDTSSFVGICGFDKFAQHRGDSDSSDTTHVSRQTSNSNSESSSASRMSSPEHNGATMDDMPPIDDSELQLLSETKPLKKEELAFRSQPYARNPEPYQSAHPTAGGTHNSNFLLQHLEHLPPNHALKLLARCQSIWGTTLEALTTLTLVRDKYGRPDYFLALSTPDTRRIVKRTNFPSKPHSS